MTPGVDISINNHSFSGTSMATGITASAYSLLLSLNTNTTKDTEVMFRSATDLNRTGHDIFTGYGLLNVSLSIEVLQDHQKPAIATDGQNVTITDNVGIYKIQTPSKTIVLQGLNRSVTIQLPTSNTSVVVEDLAGNMTRFTYKTSEQVDSLQVESFMAVIMLILIKKKIKI